MNAFGRKYHLRILCQSVSQSVLSEVLNAVSDDVFKRKCLFNGEIVFYSGFKKDTEKVVLLN